MIRSIKSGIERKTAGSINDLSEEHFEALAKAGTDAVEISLPPENYPVIKWKKVKDYAKKNNVELWSFHLPFSPFPMNDISSLDDFVRKTTLDYHKVLIDRAADLSGIKTIVIHGSGEPITEKRDERMKRAGESLAILAEYAAQYGAVIALEDLPRTCLGKNSDEIKELISVDGRLRVCFDTNHLLGNETPADFIRALGDKIITTHFSDYDRLDEKHWLPGEGVIDWVSVMDAFDEIGYKGPVLYELGYGSTDTIKRERVLTPEDFVNNHRELEARKKLTLVGNPVKLIK